MAMIGPSFILVGFKSQALTNFFWQTDYSQAKSWSLNFLISDGRLIGGVKMHNFLFYKNAMTWFRFLVDFSSHGFLASNE